MDLIALLPWWAGVALAVVSYVFFHSLAARPLSTSPGSIATSAVISGFAVALQYLMPGACLVGAVLSAVRRRGRAKLLATASHGETADALHGMTWQQFESLVGEAFRRQGYVVHESGGGGADGGVDLQLRREGQLYLVQCKQWRAFKVGVNVVRELYGVMAARGAAGGFVVTSGRFTEEASSFASGRNVKLIDGPQLFDLIRSAQTQRHGGGQRAGSRPSGGVPTEAPLARDGDEGVPTCPKCARPMVRRQARQGANAGQSFWGCAGYPSCRGTRPLA